MWTPYIPGFWRRHKMPQTRGTIGTVVNPNKDRTLAGKKRVKARRAARKV